MFQEDICEERFYVNRGRDEFIDQVLEATEPVSEDDLEDISELLDHL